MHYFSGKEKKELKTKVPSEYNIEKKDKIYLKDSIIYKENCPLFIKLNEKLIPHLKSIPSNSPYKSVYIDYGAIPFIIKGADLMRPGISKIETGFNKEDIILIRDEVHKKILAVGIAILGSAEMEKETKGKVVKIIHHIKDKFY